MSIDQQEQPQPKTSELQSVEVIKADGGRIFRTRDEIKKFVEPPLVEACEKLWDLNILTLNSSANRTNIEIGYAYIGIDRESLSPENAKVAEEIGEVENEVIYLHIPVKPGNTIGDVEQKSIQLIRQFKKQPMTWAPTFTIKDLKTKIARVPADFPKYNDPKLWQEAGYYYDQASKLFYFSEEHFKKATEEV